MRHLGLFLKERRVQAGLTLERAATYLDIIPATTLADIESGALQPAMAQIYACANIYNVSPEDMIKLTLSLKDALPDLDFKLAYIHNQKIKASC